MKILILFLLISVSAFAQTKPDSIPIGFYVGGESNVVYGRLIPPIITVHTMERGIEQMPYQIEKDEIDIQGGKFDLYLMNEQVCLIMNKRYRAYRKCMLKYLNK